MDAELEQCIYLAERIKDSSVLRRNVKKRSEWLKTLIEKLQTLTQGE